VAVKAEQGITLRDVAEAAGVHVSTASRALDPDRSNRVNAATAARVRAQAARLGYRPDVIARGLRRGRTATVGVVVADLANPFLVAVLRGVENVLEPRGFMPLIAETRDEPANLRTALERLADRRVDALITTAAVPAVAEDLASFAEYEAPVVLAVRSLTGTGLPTVDADEQLGGELVAGFLVQLGHRTLAQLCGPQQLATFADRARAFAATATRLRAEIVEFNAAATEPTFEEGRRLMGYLLAHAVTRPSAIFVHNDPMAVGALDVLKRSGLRCPEDISIVGYNDNPYMDQVCPPLTTVRIHSYEIGREAATMCLRLLTDEAVEDIRIAPELVVRDSTARWTGGEQ
jgi:LacI family transcriptional regulator